MKCAREVKLCGARSVELFVDVHVVKRQAVVDVQCVLVIRVVIGVHFVVLSVPLIVVPRRSNFPCCDTVSISSHSFSRSHFSHMFSLYFHGILGVVFTPTVGYSRPAVSCKRSNCNKASEFGKIMP